MNKDGDRKYVAQSSMDGNSNDAFSSRTGFPTDDQTNCLQSLNHEVLRRDQVTDAPSFKAEVPRPAVAEGAVYLSNQGMRM